MAKVSPIRRVRSLIRPNREVKAAQDNFADLLDTIEGRNNSPKRELPPLDSGQMMQVLIVRTAKEPCYLCKGTPYGVQIFRIPKLERIPSHEAMIFYSLCMACKAEVGSTARAEKLIMEYIQFEKIKAARAQ